eukprot:358829-Chlamydomonas_euryale.AAC.8
MKLQICTPPGTVHVALLALQCFRIASRRSGLPAGGKLQHATNKVCQDIPNAVTLLCMIIAHNDTIGLTSNVRL